MENTLIGSSPTFDGIKKVVTDYFYGSEKEFKEIASNTFEIYNKNGSKIDAIVKKVAGRYRFEQVPKTKEDEITKEKVVSLGFGSMGSGITVWDRNTTINGDYVTVAHIGDYGEVKYYSGIFIPDYAKKEIENYAKKIKDKMKVNITEETIKKTEQADGSDFMKNYSENRQALDEFFTPLWVARVMYKLAIMHGFNGEGSILEPSFGHGVFFDVLKENLIPETNMWGFELYKPNFDFVKEAYPNAHLINRQFEYEFAKNFKALNRDGIYKNELFSEEEFALVIGNPPYGSHKSEYDYLFDKDAQIRIEGFFIYLALQKLKKGGLLIFIINSLWMHNDNKYNKQKQLIYQLGELIDAYRLPNNVFKGENRDTSIASDIVIFRKK